MDPKNTKTQHGYLVLADISGYTSFVAGTELEHAYEILTELLELLIGRLTPTLTLSKLEGDAVFAYAPEVKFSRGEALLELIEATYLAFKDRVEGIRRRTTCECRACRSLPNLDLKFIVHHGDFITQNVAGIHELVGSDVNLIHRLSKNHVSEATGWRAYALFTERSLEHVCGRLEGMHPQMESYEHLGEVQTYSLNLLDRYKEITEARRVFISAEEADATIVVDFAAPAPIVWDFLNNPYQRQRWGGEGATSRAGVRPGGRTGVGARNHCAHGKGVSMETILDWRPFDYATIETKDDDMLMLRTVQLEPLPDGRSTRMHCHIKVQMPGPAWLRRAVVKFMMTKIFKFDQMLVGAARMLAEDQRSQMMPQPLAGAASN